MANFWSLSLLGKVPGGAGLIFLRAEVPLTPDPLCALIRYSWDGEEPATGLRLDLTKQCFLDHFEPAEPESPQEAVARTAVPRLIELVYAELNRRGQ